MANVYKVGNFEFLKLDEATRHVENMRLCGEGDLTIHTLERCNCEAQDCTNHWPGSCPRPANPYLRIRDLGGMCPECFQHYPEEYHVKFCPICGDKIELFVNGKPAKYCGVTNCNTYPHEKYGVPSCRTCKDKGFQSYDCPDCGR